MIHLVRQDHSEIKNPVTAAKAGAYGRYGPGLCREDKKEKFQ
jgi:hypothetical protein